MNAFQFSLQRPSNRFVLYFQDDVIEEIWETEQQSRITTAIVGSSSGGSFMSSDTDNVLTQGGDGGITYNGPQWASSQW